MSTAKVVSNRLNLQLNQKREFNQFRNVADARALNEFERQLKAVYKTQTERQHIHDVFEKIRANLDRADALLSDGDATNDTQGLERAQRAAELLLRELANGAERGSEFATATGARFERIFNLPAETVALPLSPSPTVAPTVSDLEATAASAQKSADASEAAIPSLSGAVDQARAAVTAAQTALDAAQQVTSNAQIQASQAGAQAWNASINQSAAEGGARAAYQPVIDGLERALDLFDRNKDNAKINLNRGVDIAERTELNANLTGLKRAVENNNFGNAAKYYEAAWSAARNLLNRLDNRATAAGMTALMNAADRLSGETPGSSLPERFAAAQAAVSAISPVAATTAQAAGAAILAQTVLADAQAALSNAQLALTNAQSNLQTAEGNLAAGQADAAKLRNDATTAQAALDATRAGQASTDTTSSTTTPTPTPQTLRDIILKNADPAVQALVVTSDQAKAELATLRQAYDTTVALADKTPEGKAAAAPILAKATRLLAISDWAIKSGLADEANAMMAAARTELRLAVIAAANPNGGQNTVVLTGDNLASAQSVLGAITKDDTQSPLNWAAVTGTPEEWAASWIVDGKGVKSQYAAIETQIAKWAANADVAIEAAETQRLLGVMNQALDAFDYDAFKSSTTQLGTQFANAGAKATGFDSIRQDVASKIKAAAAGGIDISTDVAQIEPLLASTYSALQAFDGTAASANLSNVQKLLEAIETKLVPGEVAILKTYIEQAKDLAQRTGATGQSATGKLNAAEQYINAAQYARSTGNLDAVNSFAGQARGYLESVLNRNILSRATGKKGKISAEISKLLAEVRDDPTPARVAVQLDSVIPDAKLNRLDDKSNRLYNQMSNLNRRGIDLRHALLPAQQQRLNEIENYVNRQLGAAATDLSMYDIVGVEKRHDNIAEVIREARGIINNGLRRAGRLELTELTEARETVAENIPPQFRGDSRRGDYIRQATDELVAENRLRNITTQGLMNLYKQSGSGNGLIEAVNDLVNPNFDSEWITDGDNSEKVYIGIDDGYVASLHIKTLAPGRSERVFIDGNQVDLDDKETVLRLLGEHLFGKGWNTGYRHTVHKGETGNLGARPFSDFNDLLTVSGLPKLGKLNVNLRAGDDTALIAPKNLPSGKAAWLNNSLINLGDGADTLGVNVNIKNSTILGGNGDNTIQGQLNARNVDIETEDQNDTIKLNATGRGLTIDADGGDDVIMVNAVGKGVRDLSIDAGRGDDQAVLNGTGAAFRQVVLNLGEGDDTAQVLGKFLGQDGLTVVLDPEGANRRGRDSYSGNDYLYIDATGNVRVLDGKGSTTNRKETFNEDTIVVAGSGWGEGSDDNQFVRRNDNDKIRTRVLLGDKDGNNADVEIVRTEDGETLKYDEPVVLSRGFFSDLLSAVSVIAPLVIPGAGLFIGAAAGALNSALAGNGLGVFTSLLSAALPGLDKALGLTKGLTLSLVYKGVTTGMGLVDGKITLMDAAAFASFAYGAVSKAPSGSFERTAVNIGFDGLSVIDGLKDGFDFQDIVDIAGFSLKTADNIELRNDFADAKRLQNQQQNGAGNLASGIDLSDLDAMTFGTTPLDLSVPPADNNERLNFFLSTADPIYSTTSLPELQNSLNQGDVSPHAKLFRATEPTSTAVESASRLSSHNGSFSESVNALLMDQVGASGGNKGAQNRTDTGDIPTNIQDIINDDQGILVADTEADRRYDAYLDRHGLRGTSEDGPRYVEYLRNNADEAGPNAFHPVPQGDTVGEQIADIESRYYPRLDEQRALQAEATIRYERALREALRADASRDQAITDYSDAMGAVSRFNNLASGDDAELVAGQLNDAYAKLRSQLNNPDLTDAQRTMIQNDLGQVERAWTNSASLRQGTYANTLSNNIQTAISSGDRTALNRWVAEANSRNVVLPESLKTTANNILDGVDIFSNTGFGNNRPFTFDLSASDSSLLGGNALFDVNMPPASFSLPFGSRGSLFSNNNSDLSFDGSTSQTPTFDVDGIFERTAGPQSGFSLLPRRSDADNLTLANREITGLEASRTDYERNNVGKNYISQGVDYIRGLFSGNSGPSNAAYDLFNTNLPEANRIYQQMVDGEISTDYGLNQIRQLTNPLQVAEIFRNEADNSTAGLDTTIQGIQLAGAALSGGNPVVYTSIGQGLRYVTASSANAQDIGTGDFTPDIATGFATSFETGDPSAFLNATGRLVLDGATGASFALQRNATSLVSTWLATKLPAMSPVVNGIISSSAASIPATQAGMLGQVFNTAIDPDLTDAERFTQLAEQVNPWNLAKNAASGAVEGGVGRAFLPFIPQANSVTTSTTRSLSQQFSDIGSDAFRLSSEGLAGTYAEVLFDPSMLNDPRLILQSFGSNTLGEALHNDAGLRNSAQNPPNINPQIMTPPSEMFPTALNIGGVDIELDGVVYVPLPIEQPESGEQVVQAPIPVYRPAGSTNNRVAEDIFLVASDGTVSFSPNAQYFSSGENAGIFISDTPAQDTTGNGRVTTPTAGGNGGSIGADSNLTYDFSTGGNLSFDTNNTLNTSGNLNFDLTNARNTGDTVSFSPGNTLDTGSNLKFSSVNTLDAGGNLRFSPGNTGDNVSFNPGNTSANVNIETNLTPDLRTDPVTSAPFVIDLPAPSGMAGDRFQIGGRGSVTGNNNTVAPASDLTDAVPPAGVGTASTPISISLSGASAGINASNTTDLRSTYNGDITSVYDGNITSQRNYPDIQASLTPDNQPQGIDLLRQASPRGNVVRALDNKVDLRQRFQALVDAGWQVEITNIGRFAVNIDGDNRILKFDPSSLAQPTQAMAEDAIRTLVVLAEQSEASSQQPVTRPINTEEIQDLVRSVLGGANTQADVQAFLERRYGSESSAQYADIISEITSEQAAKDRAVANLVAEINDPQTSLEEQNDAIGELIEQTESLVPRPNDSARALASLLADTSVALTREQALAINRNLLNSGYNGSPALTARLRGLDMPADTYDRIIASNPGEIDRRFVSLMTLTGQQAQIDAGNLRAAVGVRDSFSADESWPATAIQFRSDPNDDAQYRDESSTHGQMVSSIAIRGIQQLALFASNKNELLANPPADVRVTNVSIYVADEQNSVLFDAFRANPDQLYVVAAGNEGGIASGNSTISVNEQLAARLPNVLYVASLDDYGRPSNFSVSGADTGIAAQGERQVVSDYNGYSILPDGTSFSAPIVTNIAVKASLLDPGLSAAQLKTLIIETGDNAASLRAADGSQFTQGGALNEDRVLNVAALSGMLRRDTPLLDALKTLGINNLETDERTRITSLALNLLGEDGSNTGIINRIIADEGGISGSNSGINLRGTGDQNDVPRFISQSSMFHPDADVFNRAITSWSNIVTSGLSSPNPQDASLEGILSRIEPEANALAREPFSNRPNIRMDYGRERTAGMRNTILNYEVFQAFIQPTLELMQRDWSNVFLVGGGRPSFAPDELASRLQARDPEALRLAYARTIDTSNGELLSAYTTITPNDENNPIFNNPYPFTIMTLYPSNAESIAAIKSALSDRWAQIQSIPSGDQSAIGAIADFMYDYNKLYWHIHGDGEIGLALIAGYLEAKGFSVERINPDIDLNGMSFQTTREEYIQNFTNGLYVDIVKSSSSSATSLATAEAFGNSLSTARTGDEILSVIDRTDAALLSNPDIIRQTLFALNETGEFVFRVDTRTPDEIAASGGFRLRDDSSFIYGATDLFAGGGDYHPGGGFYVIRRPSAADRLGPDVFDFREERDQWYQSVQQGLSLNLNENPLFDVSQLTPSQQQGLRTSVDNDQIRFARDIALDEIVLSGRITGDSAIALDALRPNPAARPNSSGSTGAMAASDTPLILPDAGQIAPSGGGNSGINLRSNDEDWRASHVTPELEAEIVQLFEQAGISLADARFTPPLPGYPISRQYTQRSNTVVSELAQKIREMRENGTSLNLIDVLRELGAERRALTPDDALNPHHYGVLRTEREIVVNQANGPTYTISPYSHRLGNTFIGSGEDHPGYAAYGERARELARNQVQNNSQSPNSHFTDGAYFFTDGIEVDGEHIRLTQTVVMDNLTYGSWAQPYGSDVDKLLPVISDLFRETQTASTPEQALNATARIAWLYYQASPYVHGSAAIGQWLVTSILESHGIAYDHLSVGVSLDLEAFTRTEQDFIDNFRNFFVNLRQDTNASTGSAGAMAASDTPPLSLNARQITSALDISDQFRSLDAARAYAETQPEARIFSFTANDDGVPETFYFRGGAAGSNTGLNLRGDGGSASNSLTLDNGITVNVPPQLADGSAITDADRTAFHDYRRSVPDSFLNGREGRAYLAAGLPQQTTLGELIDFAVRDVGSQPIASEGAINWSDMHELHLLFSSASAKGEASALSAIVSNIPRDAEPFGDIFGLGPQSFEGNEVYNLVRNYLEFQTDTRVNSRQRGVQQFVDASNGVIRDDYILNTIRENLTGAGLMDNPEGEVRWGQFREDLLTATDLASTQQAVDDYFEWARNFIRPSAEQLTESLHRGLALSDYLGVNRGEQLRYDTPFSMNDYLYHLDRMEQTGLLPSLYTVRNTAAEYGIPLSPESPISLANYVNSLNENDIRNLSSESANEYRIVLRHSTELAGAPYRANMGITEAQHAALSNNLTALRDAWLALSPAASTSNTDAASDQPRTLTISQARDILLADGVGAEYVDNFIAQSNGLIYYWPQDQITGLPGDPANYTTGQPEGIYGLEDQDLTGFNSAIETGPLIPIPSGGWLVNPQLPENTQMFVMGDIHGTNNLYEAMQSVAETLTSQGRLDAGQNGGTIKTVIASIGDLGNKGPDTADVAEDLVSRTSRFADDANTDFMIFSGNHEDPATYGTLLDVNADVTSADVRNAIQDILKKGGYLTLQSFERKAVERGEEGFSVDIYNPAAPADAASIPYYQQLQQDIARIVPQDYRELALNLPLATTIGDFFLSHGGGDPRNNRFTVDPGTGSTQLSGDQDFRWTRLPNVVEGNEGEISFNLNEAYYPLFGHTMNIRPGDTPFGFDLDTSAFRAWQMGGLYIPSNGQAQVVLARQTDGADRAVETMVVPIETAIEQGLVDTRFDKTNLVPNREEKSDKQMIQRYMDQING